MTTDSLRTAVVPLALLVLPGGAYGLVLAGVVPFSAGAGVLLTAIAGVATLGAVVVRARVPAFTAGMATLGFGLGSATSRFVIPATGFETTLGSALAILGGLGFLLSTVSLAGMRVRDAKSARYSPKAP